MMALEPSRQHQGPYFQDYSIDPALVDSFSFVDSLGAYGPDLTQPSYQNTGFGHSYTDMGKPNFPVTTSEGFLSGVSTASGPSIASASSSAMGSPYSANTQTFQEDWVDTTHGLSHPTAVMGDLFSNESMVNTFDAEGVYQKKSDSFVGEWLSKSYGGVELTFDRPLSYPAHAATATHSYSSRHFIP